MDEETSTTRTSKITQSNKNENDSVSTITSESKTVRKRQSEGPRVAFANVDSTPDVSSDEETIEEPNINDSKDNDKKILPAEENGEPLIVDSNDALREIQIRTQKHLESQPEVIKQLASPSKSDEFDNEIERRGAKRSTIFLGHKIEEMLAQYPPTPRLPETESASPTAIESTTAVTSGACLSENIAVKSMMLEAPQTSDNLSILEAKAFVVILREVMDNLGILEQVIPARIDERWDESYRTIDEKYGTPEEPEVMFREDMGLLPLLPTISEKLQRDRTYMYNILKGTIRDIQCVGRYDRLETEEDDIVRILEGERNLEINNEIWMGQVKQLQELINSESAKNEEEIKNLLVMAQEMNAEVDNATFSNNSKLEYIERWEEVRLEQQKLRLELKEQEINDALGNCATTERTDQIISGEVTSFLQANTKDLEDDTVAWGSRYNEEIERVQQEINEMKEKIELKKLNVENLEELREKQKDFLDKRHAEEELAEREAEYWEAVHNAATLIQSLWRGYMVRHKLGGYAKLWASLRKRKNKKKKKKKTKKK